MPVAYPSAAERRRPPRPDTVVPAIAALLVLASLAGLVPPLSAAALAVGLGCALAGVRLSRLAGARAVAPGSAGWGVRRPALSRRVLALLGATVLAAGLTVAVLPLTDPAYRLPVVLVGLAVVAPLTVEGLLRLPGRARLSGSERLRRTVDVVGLGVSLVFASWVLLPPGPVPPAARAASVAGPLALAMLAVAALADRRRRPGAALCLAGAAATLSGLAAHVVLLAYGAPDPAALAVVPPLLVGPLLTAAGACIAASGAGRRSDRPPAAWPHVTAPAGIAAAAAAHHLCAVGEFSGPAVALGLAVIPPMVLRELLTAADHRRYADRLAARGPASPDLDDVEEQDRSTGHGFPTDRPAGLADRRELLRELARREGGSPPGTLLVVDLHGIGPVNERRGPVAGDEVLVEVGRRLRAGGDPRNLVARLPGAEFAVLTDAGPVLAYALGTRLLAALAEPYPLPGGPVRLRASVGLAEVAGGDPEDVLGQADLARRRAVQLGGERVEWYDAHLEEQLVRRLDLERELPGAVARGELDLVYQPVLTLADRFPVGIEALLRWRNPVLGTVFPAELLPVAEDLDLVDEVGRWVLDRACRQLADWSAEGRQLWMSVNVTPRELTAPDFVARTAAALAAYGVPPERLVVEVAEPRVGGELSTVATRLAGLRSLGVRTALDDFRAEHASLAQLRRLPVDLLKVGPEVVAAAGEGQRPLIDVLVSLGDRLGLEVVVAGLESEAQVAVASRSGCRYGQGYALTRPATPERVEAWLEELRPTLR